MPRILLFPNNKASYLKLLKFAAVNNSHFSSFDYRKGMIQQCSLYPIAINKGIVKSKNTYAPSFMPHPFAYETTITY